MVKKQTPERKRKGAVGKRQKEQEKNGDERDIGREWKASFP
jgi:hypothetical protein